MCSFWITSIKDSSKHTTYFALDTNCSTWLWKSGESPWVMLYAILVFPMVNVFTIYLETYPETTVLILNRSHTKDACNICRFHKTSDLVMSFWTANWEKGVGGLQLLDDAVMMQQRSWWWHKVSLKILVIVQLKSVFLYD